VHGRQIEKESEREKHKERKTDKERGREKRESNFFLKCMK
jgi:hypothetical protein